MKVLVTGGAGFIGSHVVDQAVADGHEVVIVDDLSTGKSEWIHPKAKFYQVDIRDSALSAVFDQERPEVVSHQAAKANVRESMDEPLLYADVNVLGSLRLLECCREFGVRRVVYASTGGAAYGEPEVLPVPENHPVNPLDPYGASKHHVEHYLYLYRHNFGLDYAILRYPNVFGPRQDPQGEAGVVAIFTHLMLSGGQPVINGTGQQSRDYVHVTDVARANAMAFRATGGNVWNIGSGVGTTVNQIYAELAFLTNYTGHKVHGPAKRGEVSGIFLDPSRANRELGWVRQIPLREGLASTVRFFRHSLAAATPESQLSF
jgi:UDP-glucose 4-epimerase